jgi:hypothetical protein
MQYYIIMKTFSRVPLSHREANSNVGEPGKTGIPGDHLERAQKHRWNENYARYRVVAINSV